MRIWLYYAEVGGGHKAPAQALAATLEKIVSKKVEITWIDYGALAGKLYKRMFEGGYAGLIHRFSWLYALLYEITRLRPMMWLSNAVASMLVAKKITRSLQREQPKLIVATHFLIGPLMQALRQQKLAIPVVMVVTDPYSAPPVWFFYKKVQYIVASEAVRQTALAAGVPAANIHVMPQIVNTKDWEVEKKDTTLSAGEKSILIVGGANGFPKAEKVVEALLCSSVAAPLVVVCGTNKALQEKIQHLAAKSAKKITIYGYVDFLPALIEQSGVVVSKAGAGVVHEVLHHNKPLILAHFIWGQEKGNKDFVVDNGLGFYEPKAKNIPGLVQECLENAVLQKRLSVARKQHVLQNGVTEAATYLASFLKAGA